MQGKTSIFILICIFLFGCGAISSRVKTLKSSGCNYCTSMTCTPAVVPTSVFNAKEDVARLQAAIKKKNAVELMNILSSRSDSQRMQISIEYLSTGGSLIDDIKKSVHVEVKGIFEAFMTPLPLFYVNEIHDALKENYLDTVFEMLSGLPNCAIREITFYYRMVYKVPLVNNINKNWGYAKTFLEVLAKGNRNETNHIIYEQAAEEAVDLIESLGHYTGKRDLFVKIYTKNSFPQLRQTMSNYNYGRLKDNRFENTIKDIRSIFQNEFQKGIEISYRIIYNQPEFFAREFFMTLFWQATEQGKRKLIRMVRSRSELDLVDIRQEFKKRYGDPLEIKLKAQPPATATAEMKLFSQLLNVVVNKSI